jgi:hypothetical protein
MKWNTMIENIAGDIIAFMDDLRASGHLVESTWVIARQIVSQLQCLGLQDAPRKRRPTIHTPGAWAGSMLATMDKEFCQSVAQNKWDRTKALLVELLLMLSSAQDGMLDYKRLEEIRGLLGPISMIYTLVTPYLKGLHLTLASHHAGRNEFGWKMPPSKWAAYLNELVESGRFLKEEANLLAQALIEPKNPKTKEGLSYSPHGPNEQKPLPPPPKSLQWCQDCKRMLKPWQLYLLNRLPPHPSPALSS